MGRQLNLPVRCFERQIWARAGEFRPSQGLDGRRESQVSPQNHLPPDG
jgi:hypothetical protein